MDFHGMEVHGFEVTEDMALAVQVYVDHCRGLKAEPMWIEKKVTLSAMSPPANMWGTADFIGIVGDTLHVCDLKFGKGIIVDVEKNPQLMYYALGAYLSLSDDHRKSLTTIVSTIVQPRVETLDPVRSFTYSVEELLEFAGELMDAADAALAPDAPLHAGDHCHWCPAASTCPEKRAEMMKVAMIEFAPVKVAPTPEELTLEQLQTVLARASEVENWIQSVRDHVRHKLQAGGGVEGWKLVQSKPRRKWALCTEELVTTLRARGYRVMDIFEKGVRSPAQLEKLTKRDTPDDLVVRVSSGVSLVPVSDPRPEVKLLSAEDEFEAVAELEIMEK